MQPDDRRGAALLIAAALLGLCAAEDASGPPAASSLDSQSSPIPSTEARTAPDESMPADPQTSQRSAPATEPSLVARTVTPIATIDVGHGSNAMTVSPDAVWIGSPSGLTRIDPETYEQSAEIAVPNDAGFANFGFGSAWVSDYEASILRRVDPDSGAILAEIATGTNPEGIAVTADAIWVANHRDGTVTRVDPATNAVVATISVGPSGQGGPQWLVAAGDSVWAGVPNAGAVVRIDATTNSVVAETPVSSIPGGALTIIDDRLWVTTDGHSAVVIDPQTNEEIGAVPLGGVGGGTFSIGDRVWIVTTPDSGAGRIVGIDPETLTVTDAIVLDDPAWGAAAAFGAVWVNHESGGSVSVLPLDAFE